MKKIFAYAFALAGSFFYFGELQLILIITYNEGQSPFGDTVLLMCFLMCCSMVCCGIGYALFRIGFDVADKDAALKHRLSLLMLISGTVCTLYVNIASIGADEDSFIVFLIVAFAVCFDMVRRGFKGATGSRGLFIYLQIISYLNLAVSLISIFSPPRLSQPLEFTLGLLVGISGIATGVYTLYISSKWKNLPPNSEKNTDSVPHVSSYVQDNTFGNEYLSDITYIDEIKCVEHNIFVLRYEVLLATEGFGWEYMKSWADYIISADFEQAEQVTCASSIGTPEREVTQSFFANGSKCQTTPELETETAALAVAGRSKALKAPIKIVWFNQTRALRLLTPLEDEQLIRRYIETMVRRTFGTKDSMRPAIQRSKQAKGIMKLPLSYKTDRRAKPSEKAANRQPVTFDKTQIHFDSAAYMAWEKKNRHANMFEAFLSLPLSEREPVIALYEDGVKTVEYRLQALENEDFTGKYFNCYIMIQNGIGIPPAAGFLMEGSVSDYEYKYGSKSDSKDILYRTQVQHLAFCGISGKMREIQVARLGLIEKALKFRGHTVPSNMRLVGICFECKKSFTFHAYSCYMGDEDVAYSDDGLDCCAVSPNIAHDVDWKYELDGKTFRYYNSFCCPHCGRAYIDYKGNPDIKKLGESACVHLGRSLYRQK